MRSFHGSRVFLIGSLITGTLALNGCRYGPADSELRSLWEICLKSEEECIQAAAATLPMDETSFTDPPAPDLPPAFRPPTPRSDGRKLFLASVHTLATESILPLVPRAPQSKNTSVFPPLWRDIFESRPQEDPRRALFEWVFSKFGLIQFETATKDNWEAASYYPLTSKGHGVLTLNQRWLREAVSSSNDLRAQIAISAATLVHEATHATGQVHSACPNGIWDCDGTEAGPHGLAIFYLLARARASTELLNAPLSTACATEQTYILHPHTLFQNAALASGNGCSPSTISLWFQSLESQIQDWEKH